MRKAIYWLKLIPRNHPEWYLRIQPLMAVGLLNWLEKEQDIQRVRDLFETDTIGSLPVKVALALELLREGFDVPKLELTEKSVIATLRKEEGELYSFAGGTNVTTLYCSFLSKINCEKHQEIISCSLRWVLLRQIEKLDINAICWEESYGRTAYVVLNLLDLQYAINDREIFLSKSLAFFRPKPNGAMPKDVIPAHDSHSSTYITILFIRVYATIMQQDLRIYRKAFGELISDTKSTRLRSRYLFRAVWCWGFSLLAFVATGGVVYFVLGKDFVMSVAASVIAAMLPSLVVLMRKLYVFLFEDK
ncbi:MAG TPA: hypothetical protein ACFYEJ_06720 [Candidatus Wujingus californicus]|uniref:hypothetical protein n=1 Tax=Candidatus Wujingus californicus TaxID=3367618 RepID=UPI001DF33099|nr:hypothetical protein [Planctomycetota bacterium]